VIDCTNVIHVIYILNHSICVCWENGTVTSPSNQRASLSTQMEESWRKQVRDRHMLA